MLTDMTNGDVRIPNNNMRMVYSGDVEITEVVDDEQVSGGGSKD